MPWQRQASFAGGELAPELWGRSDLEKYGVALRRCRNFFIAKQGALMSRPGTSFIAEVKSSSAGAVRLIPFVYSDTQTFVLEFGNLYVRFYSNGAQVQSLGVPLEVATPYTSAEVSRLKYAQQGAVLTLCHPNHPPAELSWDGATWTYSPISFNHPAYSSSNWQPRILLPPTVVGDSTHPFREWEWWRTAVVRDDRGVVYETAPTKVSTVGVVGHAGATDVFWSSGTSYALGDYVVDQGLIYKSLVGSNLGNTPASSPLDWQPDANTTTGLTNITQFVLYPDKPVVLQNGTGLADANLLAFRWYRGRDGVLGWVGDATTKADVFTDVGDEPDFAIVPPQGRNPFVVLNADGTVKRTEYPACVSFFEQRRVFGNTTNRPGYLFASATGDYANFDKRLVPVADEELEFELATQKLEEIRSLLGTQALLAFTSSSVWAVSGSGGPLSFDSVDAHPQPGSVGANWLDPLDLDGGVVYARTKGTGVRAVSYDLARQAFTSADLTELSAHLFRGHQLVDWAFAEDPWGVVWAVREDGLLLSLTFDRNEQVWAWAWHDLDAGNGGAFESVCVVPETSEDAVYLVERLTVGGVTKRYVVRMDSRLLALDGSGNPDPVQAKCLDCAVTYSGAATTTVSGLAHLEGKTVNALADGNVVRGLVVSGGAVTLPLAASLVRVGLAYTPEAELLDVASAQTEAKAIPKAVNQVLVEVNASRGFWVGQDFDSLFEWQQRTVADGYGALPLETQVVTVPVSSNWELGGGGRACIRQVDPLPLSVLSVSREVAYGSP